MIKQTISTTEAQRFYDRLGRGHDKAEIYEGRAKQQGIVRLNLAPGQRVLNVGVGTGREHRMIQAAVAPGGVAYGLDRSPIMLKLTQERTGAAICRADARWLPYASGSFDRLFSSYLLDLIPAEDLPNLLAEFRRVLEPGGLMALVSLTEGVNLPSRVFVSIWKFFYDLNPVYCGGCRPLKLAQFVKEAGFGLVQREVIVQLGVPSEIVVATK